MDYEKYYKIMQDGMYCIHFVNRKGYTKEEISDTFSLYGNVVSVFSKGDIINGLVFIKYKTLDETSYCLESLQKNNDIRILPQKDKISKQGVQKNSNEWHVGRTDNLPQKPFTTNKQHTMNSTYNDNNLEYEEKTTCNGINSDYNNRSDCADNFSNSSSSKSRHDYRSSVNAIKQDKLNSSDEKLLQYPKQQNFNYRVPHYHNQVKHQEINVHELSKSEENTYIKTSNDSQIPSLTSEPKETYELNRKLDQSSAYIKDTLPESVITMIEVIVANIHSNYSVNYILHLFEKHSPIAATFVKTIYKTDIRYCLVYFLNMNDAAATEEEFDNFALSGRNLIVLRKFQFNNVISK